MIIVLKLIVEVKFWNFGKRWILERYRQAATGSAETDEKLFQKRWRAQPVNASLLERYSDRLAVYCGQGHGCHYG